MATTKKVNRSSTKAKPKVNVARTKKSSIATKSLNSTKLANDSATSSTSKVENIALIQSETESTSKTQSSVNESETVVKSEPQPSHNTVEKTTITPTDANASKEEQSLASNMEIFKMQNFEIPFAVREVAEKSIEQARATYDKVKSAAEAATSVFEDSAESSRKHVVKINEKVLDAAKANTGSTFEFCKDVIAVKSLSEVMELQSDFAQKQFAAFSKQGKELQDLSSKFATEFTAPAKEAFDKVFGAVQAS